MLILRSFYYCAFYGLFTYFLAIQLHLESSGKSQEQQPSFETLRKGCEDLCRDKTRHFKQYWPVSTTHKAIRMLGSIGLDFYDLMRELSNIKFIILRIKLDVEMRRHISQKTYNQFFPVLQYLVD